MHKELKCIEIEVHQVFAQVQTLNQRFVSSIEKIEKAMGFQESGKTGPFLGSTEKQIGPIMSNFWCFFMGFLQVKNDLISFLI